MTNEDAIKWLENLKHDIGKPLHSGLWHYEQALDEIGELLEEQQEQKEKWIRDIDLYIADAEDSAKNPAARSAKGYAVGLSYGLNIAKEIIDGKRNHG